MHRVLVTDAHWRKTLATIRSLGRRGLYVESCESHPLCTGRFSRYCRRFHVAPSPYDEQPYADFLGRILRRNYEVIFPMEEATCLVLGKHRHLVPPGTRVVLPPHEKTEMIRDKKKALAIAQELGIPTPRTHIVRRPEDFRHLPLPLIIRPRTGCGTVGIRYVSSHDDAIAAWKEKDDPIVQEVVTPGHGIGVNVLMNFQSEPRAVFAHERLRENPPRGGPSTLARSIRHPQAEKWAVQLLRHIGWIGVAMVEFRVDERDGIPYFVEVNPRFWGTLQLSIASGMDFPWLLYRLAMDGDVAPVTEYRLGMHFRWILPGDLLQFRRNPNRWRDLPIYFRHLGGRHVTHAIFDPRDPAPVLGRILSAPQFL